MIAEQKSPHLQKRRAVAPSGARFGGGAPAHINCVARPLPLDRGAACSSGIIASQLNCHSSLTINLDERRPQPMKTACHGGIQNALACRLAPRAKETRTETFFSSRIDSTVLFPLEILSQIVNGLCAACETATSRRASPWRYRYCYWALNNSNGRRNNKQFGLCEVHHTVCDHAAAPHPIF